VLVTFKSDWKKAKKLLQKAADKHVKDFVDRAERQVKQATKSYLIHYNYLTPTVYTEARASGICLTIRHLTDPRKRRSISQALWEHILTEFENYEDIELAYPTTRFITD
jgi:hypothetical protein